MKFFRKREKFITKYVIKNSCGDYLYSNDEEKKVLFTSNLDSAKKYFDYDIANMFKDFLSRFYEDKYKDLIVDYIQTKE